LEASVPFLKSLKLDGILSFPPGSEAIPLTPLNVLIGPNGSGKSNLIEGIELLHALPTGFAGVIRAGGGVREWLWKSDAVPLMGTIEAELQYLDPWIFAAHSASGSPFMHEADALAYQLQFIELGQRILITDESIRSANERINFYSYSEREAFVREKSVGLDGATSARQQRSLDAASLRTDESILVQLKDPFSYPELTALGRELTKIQTFRDWSFGRDAEVRKPQPADLPADSLLPDSRNLGLLLNRLEQSDGWSQFNDYLRRFLPRFQRYTTRVEGGTVQFYLHENGLKAPIPATRLSDGTIRFMAILAQVLSPTPPPLICMEEPELGLHPDAVALLASLLHEASQRTQLIVTTHSDVLVSALTEYADSVLVCEYRGGTVMQRVDKSQLRFWLDKYSLGEIWRIGQLGGNL
jgi:predicted ATPase